MKKLLYNGKIYIDRGDFAKAILIDGDKISKVFRDYSYENYINNDDNKIEKIDECLDLKGKVVLPGLNDSHCHIMQTAETRRQVNIEGVRSIEELIDRCKKFLKDHPERCKNGIHAIGWNQDYFDDPSRLPNKYDLDKISTDIPIVLERVCGHIVSSNSKVIEILGLTEDSPQYPGGEFRKGEDNNPNGVYIGNACNYAKDTIPDFTMDERREMMIETLNYAASCGVTSVQSNDVGTTFMDGPKAFSLIRDIYSKKEAPIRYRHQVCFNDIEKFKEYLEKAEYHDYKSGKYESDMLTLGPLKLFRDGSLGARTALMRDGYLMDRDNHGEEWISEDEMMKYCKLAKEHELQVIAHVIGDGAIEGALNCFESAFIDGKNKLRHCVVHCQITDDELVDRIARNDICVMAQPIFLDYDMMIVEDLVGKKLSSTSYAFGTLMRKGAHVSYGTDSPVEDLNPFPNLYMAITRKNKGGKPEGGFYPDECVDVYEAIDAYTKESAYVEFAEDTKGRIYEGYLADLIVLEEDIFEIDPMEIKDLSPLLTMVGGKVVYRKS